MSNQPTLCRGNIYSYEYPELPDTLCSMIVVVNGHRLYPASYPKNPHEFLRITECDQVAQTITHSDLPKLNNVSNAFVHALWPNHVGYIPLSQIVGSTLQLAAPNPQKIERGHRFRLVNVLTGPLDLLEPNEYFYNETAKTFYFKSDELPTVEIYNTPQTNYLAESVSKQTLDKTIINGSGLTVSDCIFKSRSGEGLVLMGAHDIEITNCVFEDLSDAPIMIFDSTNIKITNCMFVNCCTINYDRGLDIFINSKCSNIEINGCLFNGAPKSAIQIKSGNICVKDCAFENTSWFGNFDGAITILADAQTQADNQITIQNNTFNAICGAPSMQVAGITVNRLDGINILAIQDNTFISSDRSILIGKNINTENILVCQNNCGKDLAEISNQYVNNIDNHADHNIDNNEKKLPQEYSSADTTENNKEYIMDGSLMDEYLADTSASTASLFDDGLDALSSVPQPIDENLIELPVDEPEPVVEVAEPEPVIEVAEPEPVIEVAEPEPIVEVAEPEPIVEVAEPEPIIEVAEPEPVVEVAEPEPIVEVAEPEPVVEVAPQPQFYCGRW